jgi:hypothetical protein
MCCVWKKLEPLALCCEWPYLFLVEFQLFVSNHFEGKGRLAILISPHLVRVVIDLGVYHSQVFLWIILKLDGCILGLTNIYAPNDLREIVARWWFLVNELSDVLWLFYGDFDTVEHWEDKEGILLAIIPRADK